MIGQQSASMVPTYVATYAGFWRRCAAWFIDILILGAGSGVLTGIFGQRLGRSVGTLIGWLYFAWMESSSYQATIGKMALNIYVTDERGYRIGFAQATLRYFAKILSVLTLMIGFFMVGWTVRKQALHDLLARTLVCSC